METDPGVPSAIAERWQKLLEDAATKAADYREDGWETLLVGTDGVRTREDDPFGLDVLAPTEDVEAFASLLEWATVETTHVYRADDGGFRFLIVIAEATENSVAVVVPAFFDIEEVADMRERARAEGRMYTHVRPPVDGLRVSITHDDPSVFF